MYFKETREIIKKIPILPAISYFVIVMSLGAVIKGWSNFGNFSYVITAVLSPAFIATLDWFSKDELLKAFRKSWTELPNMAQFLIIADAIIVYYLSNITKNFYTKEYGNKKISTNS